MAKKPFNIIGFTLIVIPMFIVALDIMGYTEIFFHWLAVRSGPDGFNWVPGEPSWHLIPFSIGFSAIVGGFRLIRFNIDSKLRLSALVFSLLSIYMYFSLLTLEPNMARIYLCFYLALLSVLLLTLCTIFFGWRKTILNPVFAITIAFDSPLLFRYIF